MLNDLIGNRLAIHPGESLYLAGLSTSIEAGKKTARNLKFYGRFPFRLTRVGFHDVVLVDDLLAALGRGPIMLQPPPPPPPKRPRGRPRKE